jgi:hypothetical protein
MKKINIFNTPVERKYAILPGTEIDKIAMNNVATLGGWQLLFNQRKVMRQVLS